jgi:atlastin
MWSEPFTIKKDGEEITILLMYTQGCLDNETTIRDNAIIFALSTLLS